MSTKPRPVGLDAPIVRPLLRSASQAHTLIYRLTGGRVGGRFRVGAGFRNPVPTLLLDHIGRKSGKSFTTPLLYLEDGPDIVVVASSGGMAQHPQWFRNLMASPETRVQLGREHRLVTAREADDDERKRLWPRLVDLYADFESYDSWTDRTIPVVILSPR